MKVAIKTRSPVNKSQALEWKKFLPHNRLLYVIFLTEKHRQKYDGWLEKRKANKPPQKWTLAEKEKSSTCLNQAIKGTP